MQRQQSKCGLHRAPFCCLGFPKGRSPLAHDVATLRETAEQAAAVRAEMNGLDRSCLSCKTVDKADNPILCLSANYNFTWMYLFQNGMGRESHTGTFLP